MSCSNIRSTVTCLLACLVLAACAARSPAASDALYRDLGGKPGIAQLVNGLLLQIAGDDRIRHHFEGIHIAGFRDRLQTHFCQITGGPCTFDGRSMRESHRLLDISEGDFNALVEDLMAAMDAQGIGQGVQNRFLAVLAPMQPDVVVEGNLHDSAGH